MQLTPANILGNGGLISRRLASYEPRDEQVRMAEAVAHAIDAERHLVVEAGTGVGKSFAYLVPAVLAAAQRAGDEGRSKRLIVSTHTISLQEQLLKKDIPFLNAVLPVEFSAVLAKGRSNYISLRRLNGAAEHAQSLLIESEEQRQLRDIRRWSQTTTDGSLADLEFRPINTIWDEVRSEHGNCLGTKCPTYEQCFFYKARRRVWNADLIVVNHALFFADLALRRDGASVLPDYDVVVFDEAHTLEQVAGQHMGISVSNGQVAYLLNRLYNDRQQKGLLLLHNLSKAQQFVQRLRMLSDDFFAAVAHQSGSGNNGNGRLRTPLAIECPLISELQALAAEIAVYARTLQRPEQKIELTAVAERLIGLADSIATWLHQSAEDAVYWVEISGRRRQIVRLISAPIDVGPVLRDELFNQVNTVVLTSATLTVGKSDFRFFRERIGLTESDELKLGSPFDFREQARLFLADRMPDPAQEPRAFEQAVCDHIRRHVQETGGRAFVLFTSYRMLHSCAERLTPWFTRENLALFCQGEGQDRSALLERFQNSDRAVLFGTESFWQGVDVPGEALQNVIITKLPFSVPDQPLLEARMERIRERGGNPFMDYQLPEAAIKLRQGFGRLIRSRSDTGRVVILDPRIRTKRYGRFLLESLPDCPVELVHAEPVDG